MYERLAFHYISNPERKHHNTPTQLTKFTRISWFPTAEHIHMPRDWALNAAICTATCLIRKSLDLGWSHPQDHFTFRAAALCADSAQVPCLCKLGQCVPYMEIHPWIFPDFSRFFKVLEIAPTRKALLRFSSEKRSYPQNLWTLSAAPKFDFIPTPLSILFIELRAHFFM